MSFRQKTRNKSEQESLKNPVGNFKNILTKTLVKSTTRFSHNNEQSSQKFVLNSFLQFYFTKNILHWSTTIRSCRNIGKTINSFLIIFSKQLHYFLFFFILLLAFLINVFDIIGRIDQLIFTFKYWKKILQKCCINK